MQSIQINATDTAQLDRLQEEFTDYQLLEKPDIPETVCKKAIILLEKHRRCQKTHHRMDMIWAYLSGMKNADSSLRFKLLSKVGRLVLVVPCSNAGEERAFLLIRQDKTPG